MIASRPLQAYLASLGYLLESLSCGGNQQNEGPTYSYHTHPDGTAVRIVWKSVPTPQQVSALNASLQAYVEATETVALDQQAAVAALSDTAPLSRLHRATIGSILSNTGQEFNTCINAINGLSAALTTLLNAITAQGSTLASIKTAANGITMPLPSPQTLTVANVINAVKADIPNQIGGNV